MDSNGVWALVGAILVGFLIKVFNMLAEWLSKALKVTKPDPLPSVAEMQEQQRNKPPLDHSGSAGLASQQTTEAPSPDEQEHP